MKTYQRVCFVLATEGFPGLYRRVARRCLPARTPASEAPVDHEMDAARAAYAQLVEDFEAKTASGRYGDVRNFFWYHTIDLGGGLVTPGDYDYRDLLPNYGFPEDMRGMTVLDVGSATGFFAFEFERRGAEVTSVDLPSIRDWDMPWHARDQVVTDLQQWHRAATQEELDHRHLHGPFEFCRTHLGSKVRRCRSPIYSLTPEKLGRDRFDLVFVGDVLSHLFSPLAALDKLASLCGGTLVVANGVGRAHRDPWLMYWQGPDRRSWFQMNESALRAMLGDLGFRNVTATGKYLTILRRDWSRHGRLILHATK